MTTQASSSPQEKAQQVLDRLDNHLKGVKYLEAVERNFGVPKSYVILGFAGLYFFLIFMNWGGQLLSNVIGVTLPTYYSIRAIESSNKDDDTQWLTYWVVFAFITLLEYWSRTLLYFIPFWYSIKTIGLLWLSLPGTQGARTVYNAFIRPMALKYVVDKPIAAEVPKEDTVKSD